MKCAKCQTENREGRKFCAGCGSKLIFTCPNCAFENLPGEKFCGECGHDLTLPSKPIPKELSFEEKLAKIQRIPPKRPDTEILAQGDRIKGERKQVTVMFCDMEGFTPLTEKLGSEEMYSIMDEVYEILIHKVHDYEGTVNELTGDGIMTLFGAPIALEDAPQRAIRSALAIHREIGCGLCVGTCPTHSLSLVRKPKTKQPYMPKDIIETNLKIGKAQGKLGTGKMIRMQVRSKLDRLLASKSK